MQGFIDDIENLTEGNEDFRRVLYTGRNLQLVLMALKPGEEIGLVNGGRILCQQGGVKVCH